MEHVRFGRTGLRVSRLCLGTMTFGFQCDDDTSFAIMDAAFDAGITFFDTADVYPLGGPVETVGRTEEMIGRVDAARRPDPRRHRARHEVLRAQRAREPWDQGNNRKNIMRAIDASLRRLRTDYVDLYQIHFYDPNVHIDETLRAMDDLVRAGKVRYVGCSNTLAYQLARAIGRSELHGISRFESVQPRYNMLFRENERELLPLCAEEDIAVIPYNPLAGGHAHRQAPAGRTDRGHALHARRVAGHVPGAVLARPDVRVGRGDPRRRRGRRNPDDHHGAPVGAGQPGRSPPRSSAPAGPSNSRPHRRGRDAARPGTQARLDELTAVYRHGDHDR